MTSGCLLDYNYFKSHYKMIAINLSQQQEFDADSKAIQQTNFTRNLDRGGQTTIYFRGKIYYIKEETIY